MCATKTLNLFSLYGVSEQAHAVSETVKNSQL